MDETSRTVITRLRRSAWAVPLAALVAMLCFGINELAYRRSHAALDNLDQRAHARLQIQRVWRLLLDAETSQRGYLLSGQGEYLEPFPATLSEIGGAMSWLQAHYAGDLQAEPLATEMARQTTAKLSELETTLGRRVQGPSGAWRELMLSGIGREKMDAFRAAAQQLLALESQRLDAERLDVVRSVVLGRHGINAMVAVSLLGLLAFLRHTLAFDRAQLQHADALQAERERLEAEVSKRTADLTELARHLQTAREDEKGHLARELHDELGALLTAAKLDAARLKRMLGTPSSEIEARLQHLNDALNQGIGLKRRIIEDLSPSALRIEGLVSALSILSREFAARSEIPVQLRLEEVGLQDGAEITAYRLVQEALTNAAKYASATQIEVVLQPVERGGRHGALVSVQDNGRGFDPGQRPGSAHGLIGMRYRVEAQRGEMVLESAPGRGTRIEAWLPIDPLPNAEPSSEPAAAAAAAD